MRRVEQVETPFGTFEAFAGDLITWQLRTYGAHQRNELAMLLSVVRAGDHVLDVGANIGTFTVPLARQALPQGRVAAFEADADIAAVLARNVARNGLADTVTVVPALVAAGAGSFTRRAVAGNTGATRFERSSGPARAGAGRVAASPPPAASAAAPSASPSRGDGAPVPAPVSLASGAAAPNTAPPGTAPPVVVLDDWLEDGGGALGGRVDVLKIDVEGMDGEVLLSARRLVERCRPVVYMEIAARQLRASGHGTRAVDAFLRGLGYRLFCNIGRRNSADDRFRIAALHRVGDGGPFFDLLAIPDDSDRLPHDTAGTAALLRWRVHGAWKRWRRRLQRRWRRLRGAPAHGRG